jgi:5-methylcytosine-specific restriction endonuclease McrA
MGRLQTLKPRTLGAIKPRLEAMTIQPVQRKRGSAGVKDRNEIKCRDQGLCVRCRRLGRVSIGKVVDHIVPLWQGGADAAGNKQLLCHPCHDEKTAQEASQRAGRA